jgi:putative aldouronate transport system substrate-binding protein
MSENAKSRAAKRPKRKNPGRNLGKVIYIALAVLVVTAAILFFTWPRETPSLTVAARTDVIAYFEVNGITDYFEETLNLEIFWRDYGTENISARVLEDVGKEDQPDVYMGLGLNSGDIATLGPELFMDITNVVDSETTIFRAALADDTSRRGEMEIDGHIYSFPTLSEAYSAEYPQKVWINTQWLQQLGRDVPETVDEFYRILLEIQQKDMNGNGLDDEVPLGVAYGARNESTFGFLINAFLTSDYDLSDAQNYLNLDDSGRVYAGVVEPQFRDALTYIQRLFREELVDANAFDQGLEALRAGSAGAEKYGVIAAQDLVAVFGDAGRAAAYQPLPPLSGGNQTTLARRSQVKTGGFLLNKNTLKYADALRLGDAMLTLEGTLTVLYGPENTGWAKADDRIAAMGGLSATWKLLNGALSGPPARVPQWYSSSVLLSQQAIPGADGAADLKTAANWQGYLNQVTREVYEPVGRAHLKNTLPELVLSAAQEAQMSAEGVDLGAIQDTLYATCRDFVTGDENIEGAFSDFVSALDEKGLTKLVGYFQDAYDRRR